MAFSMVQPRHFMLLFSQLWPDKKGAAWYDRGKQIEAIVKKINKNRGRYCEDCISDWLDGPAYNWTMPLTRGQQKKAKNKSCPHAGPAATSTPASKSTSTSTSTPPPTSTPVPGDAAVYRP
jgi:hypothetical protein